MVLTLIDAQADRQRPFGSAIDRGEHPFQQYHTDTVSVQTFFGVMVAARGLLDPGVFASRDILLRSAQHSPSNLGPVVRTKPRGATS